MRAFSFSVRQEVLALGLKIITARISRVRNSASSDDFIAYRDKELAKIRSRWQGKSYKDDPVLTGFRDLHVKVGRSNREYVAASEALRRAFLTHDRIPHINLLVDIYNLFSLKTGLALGAHDIDKINGNISLRFTKGNEIFIPLGSDKPVPVHPGEYSYIDDGNNIVCRLEVLQVEPTKVTAASNDILLIVQGNANTTDEYLKNGAEETCAAITRYCGGTCAFL
jgi:DNA/RNA-binding domain of Phe-tRNA-synthetase-like protein